MDLRISEFQNFSVSAFQLLLPSSHFIREADRRQPDLRESFARGFGFLFSSQRRPAETGRAAATTPYLDSQTAAAKKHHFSFSAFTSMTGRAAATTPYLDSQTAAAKKHHFSVSAFQRFSISAFQRFSVSAFQRFSVSAFQLFSVSAFQLFRISAFQRFSVSAFTSKWTAWPSSSLSPHGNPVVSSYET